MRIDNVSDPVYAPNSKGGPKADPERYPEVAIWSASGEFIRAAYTKRKDDDDFGQPGTLVRKVWTMRSATGWCPMWWGI